MKTIVQLMFVAIFMLVATPSYSGVATQMWKCEMGPDTKEEAVEENAAAWLKAAKQVEGGGEPRGLYIFPGGCQRHGSD